MNDWIGVFDVVPAWLAVLIIGVDLLIRLLALGWLPYRRRPSVALGWLVAIFFVPYAGLILFLVFGSSKLPRYRRERQTEVTDALRAATPGRAVLGDVDLPLHLRTSAELNYRLGALPLVGGNEIDLLEDNHASLDVMRAAVDAAQDYVHFEFYIVALDDTTRRLLESLVAAQARGVRVHVLIDHFGSLGYPGYKDLVGMLDSSGMSWRRMLPLWPPQLQWRRPDLRNHRKLLVVDGEVAYTGSQNIIDRSYNKKKNLRHGLQWKDLMMSVRGPLVAELNAVFVTDWYSETGEILDDEMDSTVPEAGGEPVLAQVVPSGPGFELENNLRLFNHLIYNANETIVIASPYLVPDESILHALTTEALTGVDVRLYLGQTGDSWLTLRAQQSYYEELLDAGVRIFLYHSPTVLHSKFMLVDDEVTVIGSSNMDERSFAMNLEVTVMAIDAGLTRRMYALEAEDYQVHSVELDAATWATRGRWHRYQENVCRLWSSLL